MSAITIEEDYKIKKQFEETIKKINYKDVIMALNDGWEKIEKFDDNPPKPLLSIWEDIKIMNLMIKDYTSGFYDEVNWKTIATISAAIIYFISPLDLVPDPIPIIGYLDDFTVLSLTLNIVEEEFNKYKKWRKKL